MKSKLTFIALIAFTSSSYAQPSGGSLVPSIPMQILITPINSPMDLPEEKTIQMSQSDIQAIEVKQITITGNFAYSQEQLLKLTNFIPGSQMTLTDLKKMANKISTYYHKKGYFLAQVYLPVQEINNGDVSISVTEGKYGKIDIRNQSGLSSGIASGYLKNIQTGQPITASPLEEDLLLLSDLPGIKVRSSLVPSTTVGASDLIVDITSESKVTGTIEADNAGNYYTGTNRLATSIHLNGPFNMGDKASLYGLTSGKGLNYMRASYQMQFGRAKTGASYSHLDYELGKEFSSLGATGTAKIFSFFGSYPLVRSRQSSIYTLLSYDDKNFEDKLAATGSIVNKKTHVLTGGFYGDHRDGFNGLNTYSLAFSTGSVNIKTPLAALQDAANIQTQGHFNKLAYSVVRQHNLNDSLVVIGSLSGQVASKNLDVSEKMSLGGMNGIRAYPEGEAYGDEGYMARLEARYLIPKTLINHIQLVGFLETGGIKINKNPLFGMDNHKTLSGAGFGVIWSEYNNYEVKVFYAGKLGKTSSTSAPDKSGKLWIQAIKYFN